MKPKKEKTMMKAPRELLNELDKLKRFKRESYAEVVKNLIDEKRRSG